MTVRQRLCGERRRPRSERENVANTVGCDSRRVSLPCRRSRRREQSGRPVNDCQKDRDVGRSPQLRPLLRDARKCHPQDASHLVTGRTGHAIGVALSLRRCCGMRAGWHSSGMQRDEGGHETRPGDDSGKDWRRGSKVTSSMTARTSHFLHKGSGSHAASRSACGKAQSTTRLLPSAAAHGLRAGTYSGEITLADPVLRTPRVFYSPFPGACEDCPVIFHFSPRLPCPKRGTFPFSPHLKPHQNAPEQILLQPRKEQDSRKASTAWILVDRPISRSEAAADPPRRRQRQDRGPGRTALQPSSSRGTAGLAIGPLHLRLAAASRESFPAVRALVRDY